MAARKLTARVKRFFLHLEGSALLDPIAAARLAGYSRPYTAARVLSKQWSDRIAEIEDRVKASVEMTSKEARGRLAAIARDKQHKDCVRSLELVLRVHGDLSDKIDVRISKTELIQHLVTGLERIQSAHAIAESASTAALPAIADTDGAQPKDN